MAYNPLFQVMFNHVRRRLGGLAAIPDMHAAAALEDGKVAKFDLGLNTLEDHDGTLSGEFVYATDLFDAATIGRLKDHYLCLLRRLCEAPAEPPDRLALLDGAEAGQLLAWSGAAAREPDGRGPWMAVHERIWKTGTRQADAAALVFETGCWTYAELLGRAAAVARALGAAGAGPECVVGVAMDRSPQMVASVLGVLAAGAAYLPLDPDYPADRLEYMMRDAGVAHVLVRGAPERDPTAALALSASVTRIDVDELAVPAGGVPAAPSPVVATGNLAYVLYTSAARPDGPRKWAAPMAPWRRAWPGCRMNTASRTKTRCCKRPLPASTWRCGKCCGRCRRARGWSLRRRAIIGIPLRLAQLIQRATR